MKKGPYWMALIVSSGNGGCCISCIQAATVQIPQKSNLRTESKYNFECGNIQVTSMTEK